MYRLSSSNSFARMSLLLFVFCQSFAAGVQDLDFQGYLTQFGKVYNDPEEYTMRRVLFEQRKAQLQAVNEAGTWQAGFNHLTDATPQELQKSFGYRKELRNAAQGQSFTAASKSLRTRKKNSLPESVDWRKQNPAVVSPVKSQGGCGSCWAFAASSVIESHVAINTGLLLTLSPQEMTSCTPNPNSCGGEGGCSGATTQLAFAYAIESGGVSDIWHDPYLSGLKFESMQCNNHTKMWTPRSASITGFVDLPHNDAEALMEAVATVGPVSVSVDASNWWMYAGGIYDSCNHTAPNINHAVVLDGYGVENGTAYWLIRNSWGSNFGEQGYIRLRRYDNEPCGTDPAPFEGVACKGDGPKSIWACGECGVLSDSSYPTGADLGAKRRLSETSGQPADFGIQHPVQGREDLTASAGVHI
mmetsp:Transcript_2969/g.5146  ORF Transcript_2969/g.5146 Transcript_2969/m.5146 type:complete len:415 (+) Transcript_2969:37-1281(+)